MAVFRNLQVDIPKESVTIEKQKDGKPALIKYVIETLIIGPKAIQDLN